MRKTTLKNKHGFTLVEIIVVLVILAIMASIASIAVLDYIEDAKQQEYVSEAHNVMIAAEYTIVNEYSKDTDFDSWRGFTNITDGNATILNQIYKYSGVDKQKYVIANIDVAANNKLIFFNLYSRQKVNGEYNRIVYLNGTIGGKKYNSEFIVCCWNGKVYHEYKKLDPGQVGYKKE